METQAFSSQSYYTAQLQRADDGLTRCRRQINQLALSRLGVLLGGATALFWAVQQKNLWVVLLLFFVILIGFFYLVSLQSKAEKRKQRWLDFRWINANELQMMEGEANAYPDGQAYIDHSHAYADDLDVLGPQSLYEKINRAATPRGQQILADWLLHKQSLAAIEARQLAAQELQTEVQWNQDFQTSLVSHVQKKKDLTPRLQQLLHPDNLHVGFEFLKRYVPIAPYIALGLGVLGWWWTPAWGWLMVLLLSHLVLTWMVAGKVSKISYGVDQAGALLSTYAEAIELIEKKNWQSPWLTSWTSQLIMDKEGQHVSKAFAQLGQLLQQLDVRLNLLVGQVLNMLLLWDFKQVFALQSWRTRFGTAVFDGLEVLAQVEAIQSIATLARNHPHWAYPILEPDHRPIVVAEDLGHPLIPTGSSVVNSYQQTAHQIALITGSNMAGKSTFLRTLGANVVLAFAGAPVAAKQMRLSNMHLLTYMRIKDSLQEQTSTFKAELNRMQFILQQVESDPQAFFLIDEMLRGTNSVDKYLGSKAIITRLIELNGRGAVATHDLKLAELDEKYPNQIENYHFDIQVKDGEMVFDYRLKTGPCTVFNASLLLKGIGIDVKQEETNL
jgi:hypothetical protein